MCISSVPVWKPAIELFPRTTSSPISAELFNGAAGPRVGAAVAWVMGVHCAAPSHPHRSGRGPQLLGVHREGGEKESGREQECRRIERTLSITVARIDLIIQSIRWGLSSRMCYRGEEVGELALGKKGSLIRMSRQSQRLW